jgi:hypothetical protein
LQPSACQCSWPLLPPASSLLCRWVSRELASMLLHPGPIQLHEMFACAVELLVGGQLCMYTCGTAGDTRT